VCPAQRQSRGRISAPGLEDAHASSAAMVRSGMVHVLVVQLESFGPCVATDRADAESLLPTALAVVAALLGGSIASAVFGAGSSTADVTANREQAPRRPRWPSWVRPAVIVASGLAMTIVIAVACPPLDRGVWAGVSYLLTWFLLGLTAPGTLFATGRRRECWLGATFLGVGFMLVIFDRPFSFY
jgi:hypothetical protein